MRRLLIANRGEIAVRIIRTAREMGIETVLACSEVDQESLAARLADVVAVIGPAQATKSYLDVDKVLAAAIENRCDAVHPGYGFLSENARFARAVAEAGLEWVGPSADAIELMGDKAKAREAAAAAGVPVLSGTQGALTPDADLDALGAEIGFPLLVKAVSGGGGRGIRLVNSPDQLATEVRTAQAEAAAAFGDGSVYLERFIPRARHIEVQLLADGTRAIHLGDRDCSWQRRSQKVVEEAPAPDLPDDVRDEIRSSAVTLAEQCGYSGAGTVEFLYDADRGVAAFIEMNTRLQVEHPVTEQITGLDLVREQLLIAAGEGLRWQQSDITLSGHAIEVRVNAEDPAANFMPSPGTITTLDWPGGPGVRVDAGVVNGTAVVPYYDSLIAKIVTWDGTRDEAIARMRRALAETNLEGISTTIPLLADLVARPEFRDVTHHTKLIEQGNRLQAVDGERNERGVRYTWGGDEFLFVEVAEAMSLAANFTVMSIARRLTDDRPAGISDICPANASLLVRFDPDVIAPADLKAHVQRIEAEVANDSAAPLHTRIIEIPVWYDDPFTGEVGARFRSSHQTPDQTDLDFAAAENGLADKHAFIKAHYSSPWLVTMVGFVAGLPFMFQVVPDAEQLEVPKYLSPRTDTPKLTVGHGGCFACIYSVRGAGGYQMFGVAAAPIFDPAQGLADFADFMIFFKPGDLVKFRPVDQSEYEEIVAHVEAGTFEYRQAPVEFDVTKALADPHAYNEVLVAALEGAGA